VLVRVFITVEDMFMLGMKHSESRAGLARMKYLGTFQVRAGLATNKLAEILEGGRICTRGNTQGGNARNRN